MATKDVVIVGGPNGAGKTTWALRRLPSILDTRDFVNADEIARGLSPLNPEGSALAAGRLALTARCYAAGTGTLTLTVSRTTARKLRLKTITLASSRAECDGHGRFTVTLKPSVRVKRALARSRASLPLTATLKLGATTTRRTLTLRGRS